MLDIPAIPKLFVILSFLTFSILSPPNAIIGFLEKLERLLNLMISRKLSCFFVLNIGEIKIKLTPCLSLIRISLKLCAEPTNINLLKLFFFFKKNFLLNAGI